MDYNVRVCSVAMAKHVHLKLPSFRVTVRPTSGPIQKKVIYRRSTTSQVTKKLDLDFSSNLKSSDYQVCDVETSENDDFLEGPSLYQIQSKANASAWEEIRLCLLKAVVENEAMPHNQKCIQCSKVAASLRCLKCGPCAFYCTTCFLAAHSAINLFHIAEEWKVRHWPI